MRGTLESVNFKGERIDLRLQGYKRIESRF